jgi:hypothetical protein
VRASRAGDAGAASRSVMDEDETVRGIIQPYFDAVMDTFALFRHPSRHIKKVSEVTYRITSAAHDAERHFARTRTDGRLMEFATEIVDLPPDTLVAIITHEFGHSADMLYPACWSWPKSGSGDSIWVGHSDVDRSYAWRHTFGKETAVSRTGHDDKATAENWVRAWSDPTDDQIEWAADAIAFAVTGKRIGYSGRCMLQSFDTGARRPAGLR